MRALILFHLFAILYALLIFIMGFFPFKKASGGFATHRIKVNEDRSNTSFPIYRRFVLVVIDALRADFVSGPFNFLPKTHETIRDGHGLHFIARIHPPTVTLPRIKAITTGGTPSFVDVVLNFGSPALVEDNIITQMKRSGLEIIFFGDETWINLFPWQFERSDGTTSFFVSDYTEVDKNVTRHLKDELNSPTWNVMILHYLGLDHIGHVAGPNSPLVKPKLKEMDNVIRQIYNAMEQWDGPSLLVVCGDHGMSDQGGHGGASPGETSVPVLFLSPYMVNIESKHVESVSQADLCPTLSVLLGLPIPKNNVGKVITDVLIGYTLQQKLSIMHQNAIQSMQILKNYVQDLERESSYMLFRKAKSQFHEWLVSRNSTTASEWEDKGHSLLSMYSESMTLLADKVARICTQFDVYAMAVSMALLWMLLISLILDQLKKPATTGSLPASRYAAQLIIAVSTAVLSHIIMCTGGAPSDLLCQSTIVSIGLQAGGVVVFVLGTLIILTQGSNCASLTEHCQVWWMQTSSVEVFLFVGTLAHTLTLTSSSFVEEEHQTFYFLTTSLHVLLIVEAAILFVQNCMNELCVKMNRKVPSTEHVYCCGNCCTDCNDFNEKIVQTGKCDNVGQWSQCSDDSNMAYPDCVQYTFSSDHTLKSDSSNDRKASSSLHTTVPSRSVVGKKNSLLKSNGGCIKLRDFFHFCASVVSVLLILRILRRWNQTGNKWLDVPDFGDWLVLPENKTYLSLIVVFSLMIIGASQGQHLKRLQSMLVNLSLTTSYLYRVAEGSLFFPSRWFLSPRGIMEARASFFFIGLTLVVSLLPSNFFKLDPPQPKQEQQKTAPAVKKKAADISKLSQTQKLQHSKVPLYSQTGEKKLDKKSKEKMSSQHVSMSSSETQQHGNKNRLCKSYFHSTSSSRQTQEEEQVLFNGHQRLRGVAAAFLCFMCVVMRPHNTAVVALMSLVEQMMTPLLANSNMKATYILLYCLWMGQAFFFFQGNSNSLSTVDLTTGYTGLYEFIPAVTGTLLCLATYSGTIFWILTYLRIVWLKKDAEHGSSESRLSDVLRQSSSTLFLSRALPLSVYTAVVSVQRYHLFVWTVFSPKLLYEAASTVVILALAFLLLLLSLIKS